MADMKQPILQFIERINAHDVEGIVALMSKDYEFVNSSGDHFRDLQFLKDTWRAQFENHPDFKIRVDRVICDGECVGIFRPRALRHAKSAAHLALHWDGARITHWYEKRPPHAVND